MTADETEPEAQRATGTGGTSAAKPEEQRSRRETAAASGRLTRTGSPIAAAMSRVPFVATVILLLASGIVGVLWLNTMSDATGLQATASRIRQADIETDIQALQRDVNTLQDPARLAAEANRLGLVRAGDSALLQVGADGKATVLGTPTPVPGQAPPAPATTPSTTAPAATTPVTTAPAATAPTATSTKSTPSATAPSAPSAPSASASTTARATTTAPKTTARKTTVAVTTPAKTTAAKTTAPKTAPAQQSTTTTGAGR